MASNFWEGNFYFDNVFSSTYGVCIVDINSNEILKQIGNTFTISTEKDSSYNGNYLHRETERTSDNITLQLCRTDNKAWTINSISEVVNWLFKETFKKFQPLDLVDVGYNLIYYLKAIEFRKFLNAEMRGSLEVVFMPYDSYTYAIPTNALTLSNGESKNINNISNVNKIYYPKIKIVNNGEASNLITITNQTNKKSLQLSNLNKNEVIFIDCAIGSVVDNNGKNRFSTLQNFDFIGLEKGNNTISISSNCLAEFICEFPMII